MLNFVKTAIVILASTQAITLQAEADYDHHDWTIYSATHNVGEDYLDLTPESMGDYQGIYDQNIARTRQSLRSWMTEKGHGPIMKHGFWEMDLRQLTDKTWVGPIVNKAVWANIRVLVDKVPSRGDTRAFNDQEYELLVNKQESTHWRPDHLAPDAPRTESNNCFMDFYSVRDTTFGS